jgi:hypothetical protein
VKSSAGVVGSEVVKTDSQSFEAMLWKTMLGLRLTDGLPKRSWYAMPAPIESQEADVMSLWVVILGGLPSGKGREKLRAGRQGVMLSWLVEESGRLDKESTELVDVREGTGLGREQSSKRPRRVGVVSRERTASKEQRVEAGISSALMPFRSWLGF